MQYPADFVLWKGAKEGEPSWDSPWGRGRPGWHIECSAMSLKYLGEHFDIHGGGIDLKFPHHESEVLQTECHTGHSPMANYWLHSGHLTINSEKMSKSLDNFFLVRDVMADYSASVLRFYLLNGHYRSPIDFSDSNLDESVSAYRRLEGVYNRLESVTKSGDQLPEDLVKALDLCNSDFSNAMNDDFNTREALAVLFQFSRLVNGYDLDLLAKELQLKLLELFSILGGEVLGLFSKDKLDSSLEAQIKNLINQRNKARSSKDWNKSDSIRDELTALGVEIQDYSTSIAGGIAITGTVDVDIVGQTGQDPLHNDLVQIGGATAPVTDLTTILGATNPANTSFRGWTYLNTGTGILATNASGNPAYITAVSANAFGLTSTDNTIFLGLYDATPTLVANFIAFTFNHATPGGALEDGTFGYAMSFPTPIEVPNGFSVRLVGGANTWSSGSVWGHTT